MPLRGRRAGDEVELHAQQALLEVEEIHRLDAAHHALAAAVDRLVGVERHGTARAQRHAVGEVDDAHQLVDAGDAGAHQAHAVVGEGLEAAWRARR